MKEGEICLAMIKRDFGVGKYNGVGGKVKDGETIENAALREMEEEIGVTSEVRHLEGVGNLKFYFNGKPEWNQHMHIFIVKDWNGEPRESEEMKPKWYKIDKIPFDEMWKQLGGLTKDNIAIVLFGNEPFSSALRMSNIKNYKYEKSCCSIANINS